MSQPSLLVLPSQYSAGKLFAYSPLVAAPVEFEVIRATPRTRINSAGLLQSIASGIVALDYGAGSCPAFNPWEQRTNLLTWSEDFTNAAWQSNLFGNWSVASVTPNTSIAPDGTLSADTITLTSPVSNALQRMSVTPGATYTYTIYIMALAGQDYNGQLVLRVSTGNSNSLVNENFRVVNISSLVSTTEWKRFDITFVIPASGVNQVEVGVTALNALSVNAGLLAWGAQVEAGSSASPYIPTTSSSVTRNAEIIRNTSAAAYIGATQGAIAGRFIAGTNAGHIVDISTGATSNSIQIDYGNAGAGILRATVFTSGVPHTIISTTPLSAGSHGFCFTYQSGNFALYVDGVLVGTNTAAFLPTGLDEIYIGSNIGTSSWFNGSIDHVRFFKEIPNNPANESAK